MHIYHLFVCILWSKVSLDHKTPLQLVLMEETQVAFRAMMQIRTGNLVAFRESPGALPHLKELQTPSAIRTYSGERRVI